MLASCAGLSDGAVAIEPKHKTDPLIIQGQAYFDAAKTIRERPSVPELEAARAESRNLLLADSYRPDFPQGSFYSHQFIACGQAYRYVVSAQ